MIPNKSLSHNAIANITQALASGALSFALYRYINDTLGVALLGVWSVVLATASVSRFADLGIGASVTRFVALYLARNTPIEATRLIETALLSLMMLMGLFLPILYWLLLQLLPHIFDFEDLKSAHVLLPYALISLGLSMTAAVIQSGLDGCQRMDLRTRLAILSQLLMVAISFWLIPEIGLIGLALAQIVQGLFLIIGGWWMLRYLLSDLPHVPRNWSHPLFREMLGYGTNVQIASVFMLVFDPLTKTLMVRYGGATAAGYFEMANQVVLKIRALIVAANQAIVPRIAQLAETTPGRMNLLYRQNLRVLIFVALPIFVLLYAWSPMFSWLLLGQVNDQLVFLLHLNALAWLTNLFAAPAYFYNQGAGKVGLNTLSHALMGLVNGVLGWILGMSFGMDGVAWAYGIALVVGSLFLVAAFQKRSGIQVHELTLLEHKWLLVAGIIVVAADQYARQRVQMELATIWTLVIGTPIFMAAAAWVHPIRREIEARFFARSHKII